jgi:outer membrane protein OmpA-like peptidoglycan-associated protein
MNILVTDYNNKPIKGEKIQFVGKSTKVELEGVTDTDGKFKMELPGGDVYDIKIQSVGEATDYSSIEIPSIGENETFNEGTLTIMIEEAGSFTLDDLHFATGSAEIKSSSKVVLQQLAEYLKNKSSLKIEIGGHTDSDGSDTSNKELSQKRAEAVKAYLTKNGISSSRLSAKGYGESKPIASNETEQGKAQNRRTEVLIL